MLTKVANGVWYGRCISAEVCDAIVTELEKSPCWRGATIQNQINGIERNTRKAEIIRAAEIPTATKLLTSHGPILKTLKEISSRNLKPTGLCFVRYRPGDFYAAHRDNFTAYRERRYTVITYLNDNFEGGETVIADLEHHARPERGKILCFDAGLLHESKIVLSGNKYIAIYWYSEVFTDK